MVSVKTKKQLTLPQLIEWAQDNIEEATKKVHRVNENEVLGNHVRFTEVYSDLEVRLHGYIPFDTTFTVEVEEEITEDTMIPEMLEISLDKERGINLTDIHRNLSINNVKSDSKFGYETLALHVINDDCTHTLIWTSEKGLVE